MTASQLMDIPIGADKNPPNSSKDLIHISRIAVALHCLFQSYYNITEKIDDGQINGKITLETLERAHKLYIHSRAQRDTITQVNNSVVINKTLSPV